MSQGYTVKAAFDKANVDYPICGANKCMRFAGDPNLVLKVNSDSQAPIASITSPMDSEILSGSATVSISASDNIGVVRVELYKDGALFATDTSLPYQFIWDTTKDVDGSYKIQAKAYDAAGNIGTSSEVNVIVYNNSRPMDEISPIVSISSPANGAVTTKTTKINASGSDNVGIVSMLAFLDEIQVCSGTSSVLSCNIVNKKYSKGFHQITIQAADAAGNKGFSVTSVTFQ